MKKHKKELEITIVDKPDKFAVLSAHHTCEQATT